MNINTNINTNSITSVNAQFNSTTINNSLKTNGFVNLSNSIVVKNLKTGINNSSPVFNLDVNGDINYTGNLYRNGIVVITETGNSLWNQNTSNLNIWYNNNVGIGNDSPAYILDVTGDTNITGNIFISKSAYISNYINCSDISSSSSITGNSLVINNDSLFYGDVDVSGNITGNNLTLVSDISCDNITCNTCSISDSFIFTNDIIFNGNVSINGYNNILGNLTINSNKFTVNATTGDVYVDKSLTVNSSIYITTSLVVNGTSTLYNTLYVTDIQVSGNIYIQNNATFIGNITANSISSIGNLSVDNGNLLVNTTNQSLTINYNTASTSSTTGALVVNGGVGFGSDLFVSGNIINNGFINTHQINTSDIISSDLTINRDCNLFGNTICNSLYSKNLVIQNNIIALPPNLVIDNNGNINTHGTLIVDDLATFNDDVIINGNITVNGTAFYNSYYTINSYITYGNITASSLFIDNNNFTVNNNIVNIYYSTTSTNYNNGALVVTGGVGVGGNLNINGNLIVNSNVTIDNNLNVNNNLYINGAVSYNSINITSTTNVYNIDDSYSGVFFVIDNPTISNVTQINIISTQIGAVFKFLFNCATNNLKFSVNKNLFGLIINRGIYINIPSSHTIINCNNVFNGDNIEFINVNNNFYVRAESSTNNGFSF